MTKSKHNQTLKTVIFLLAVFLGFTETNAVNDEIYASFSEAGISVPDNVSSSISNKLLSADSGKYAIQDDTTGIICPDDITTYTDLNSCVAVISAGLDLIDPNNSISSLSWEMTGATEASSNGSGINQIGSYAFNEGTTVITYRGATLYNNSIFCTFTVTVSDNQVPRLENPQEDIIVGADAGDCYAFVDWAEPVVTDNCASPSQILVIGSHEPGTSFPVGTTVVNYSINDGIEYNDLEHSFTVTVLDEEIPEIFAPHDITLDCGEAIPDAYTTWQQFTDAGGIAFDNCNIDFSSFKYEGQKSSGIRCPYTITRAYSITDGEGNIAEVEHVIYVGEDEEEEKVILKSGAGTETVTITSYTITDVSCYGGSNGEIDLDTSSTAGPITAIVWSNGATTLDISGLSAGSYTVQITDQEGTQSFGPYTVDQPSAITASASVTSAITCNGGSGTVTVSASGGTSPLSYTFNGTTNSTGVFTGVLAGSGYSWSVTDANNCGPLTGTLDVAEPSAIIASASVTAAIPCNGGTGTVTISASGGTTPLSYTFNGTTNSTGIFTGVIAGTGYSWSVTDANNCGPIAGALDVTEPPALVITSHPVSLIECEGHIVTYSVTAGNITGTDIYTWQRQLPTETSFTDVPVHANFSYPSPGEFRIENVGSSVSPDGTQFRVIVTDDCGAVTSNAATLNVNEITGVDPSVSTPSITDVVVCEGTNFTYTVTTSGQTPVSYQWKKYNSPGIWDDVVDGSGISGSQSDVLSFTGLTSHSGEYKVTVTFPSSGADCNVTSDTRTRQLTVNPKPVMNSSDAVTICSEENLGLALTSNVESSYTWVATENTNVTGESTTVQTGSTITDNLTNTTTSVQTVIYTVTPTSTGGNCEGDAQTITVTVNPKPSMTSSNTVTICSGESVNLALGSDIPSTYTWIATSDNPDVDGESLNEQTGSTITDVLTISGTSYDVQTITYSVTPTANTGGCDGDAQTVTVTINPIISPYVQITIDGSANICEGELASFTSVVDDTSTYNAYYQWKINGNPVEGANGTTFSSNSLQNGDKVTLDVWTPDAPCYETSTAFGYTMTVNPTVVPHIDITESDNEICAETPVSFTSTPYNQGANPSYQWQISNDNSTWSDYAGADSSTFSIDTLTSGPRYIRVLLTSSAQCASPADTVSQSVQIDVNPVLDPSVTITSNPDTAVCPGTTIQFTATPVNQGNNPQYQWKLNGNNVGTNLPTYSSAALVNGDEVWVVMTSNIDCPVNNPVNSDTIIVSVKPGTPSIPGAIDGDIQVCPDDTLMYTIAPVANATSYNWTVSGTNWAIISDVQNDTIYVATGDPETSAIISVTAENDCGTSAAQSLAVSVYSISEPATSINVTNNNTCFGTAKILTVNGGTLGQNATWNWYTDACGITPAGTGATITVDPPAGDTVTYYVRAEGLCTTTECVSVDVIVNPATPPVPGAITGNTPVCPGETETYYIASVEDANSYAWSVPGGWTIVSGQGDTLITVTTGAAGQNGNISVTAKNDCGTSVASTLPVAVSPGQPADPGPIAGTEELCAGSSDTYSITSITNATKYNWGVPGDWTINGLDTTNTITVTAGTTDGYIYVSAENSCGETDTSWLWVTAENTSILSTPDTIIAGLTAICPPQSTFYYTNTVAGADGYFWTVPEGWTILSGQGSESIDVQVEGGASSGDVTVMAYNVCDTSDAYSIPISVDATGTINAGPDQYVCEGIVQVYMQGVIGGAINSKQDWDWESINYPENPPKTVYFDNPDSPTTLFDFPEGVGPGDSIIIEMHSTNTVGGCGYLSDTMIIYILPDPVATIETDTVCEGESATLTITATPNTRVTYVIDIEDQGTVDIGEDGTATIETGPLTENTTYDLIRIGYLPGTFGTETCTQSIAGKAVVVVNYPPVVDAGVDQIVCSNNPEIYLDGSVTGSVTTGVWSGGSGTYSTDSTDLTAIYTPTQAEIDAGFLSLILTSTDPDGPCGTVSDQVDFTFDQAPLVNAGLNDTICSSDVALLAGSFGGSATSATWSTSGDGTFDDNTKTTAIYTPGVADSTAGWVYLIYTTNNPGTSCAASSDTLTLTIDPAAYVDAGDPQTICASSTVILDGSFGGATTSATWSGGTGTFSDITSLVSEYTPSAADIAAGTVTLTLSSDDPDGPCGIVSDQVTITINPEVIVDAGIDQSICYGSSIVLEGNISGALSAGTWTSGSGTFSDATELNATFTPSVSDTTILLILTSGDPGTACGAVSDTMELRIDPVPYIYAGTDTMICEDGIAQLNGAVEAGYTGTWTTSGAGTFSSSTSPTTTYTPGNGDVFNETVIIVYTTNEVSGECGLVSDTMILTVKETIEITTQPVNTGVCALNDTSIFVIAVGDDLSYQWYFADGTAVTNTAFITGAQTASLNFHDATSALADAYYVEINSPNACGSAISDTVTLNVDQEIEVITPLTTDTVCLGDNITFSILAEPGGELLFQWLKDGVEITDSTRNELVINNATLADAGSYTVNISGMQGYTCEAQTSTSGDLVVLEDVTISPVDAERIFCINASDVLVKYDISGDADNVTAPFADLPPGLTGTFISDSMQFVISGAPTTPGVYPFTISSSGYCVQDDYDDIITINPELIAAVITIDNPDICYNEVPDPVYITTMPQGGSEPYIYQWQDSTTGTSWADYTGTGTNTSIDPPALTDTTYYRVIVTDDGIPSCGSVISNVVAIYPLDNTPPSFTVPADRVREADENCVAFVDSSSTGRPTNLSDNCTTDPLDLDVSYFDHDTIDVGCNYSFMRTWQVMDEAGNVALDTQLITVADSTPPVIVSGSRPVNQVIDCGVNTHADNLGWASFSDNCDDDVTVSYYDVVVPGSCAGDSTIYRYWVGTDACGNVDTASTATIITINDMTPPVVYDEKDTIIACAVDLPQAWQIPNFGIDDACGDYTVELVDEYAWGIDDVSGYCPYKVDRTWKVTDDCNNSVEFVQSIVITQGDTCPACKECLYDNSYNWADLTGNADSTITFYDVVKRDKCCGAENQPGGDNLYCASFNIKIDPYAVGVEILVDHVTPPGQDWQVDCEEVDGGKVVCLEPGRFHLFTFCKHAESEQPQENDYTFRSISGLLEGGDIETREECDKVLEVNGTFEQVQWNSVYPGAVGEYNHLLSSTTDTIVNFNAEPGSPPHIQYQVCGQLSQSLCFTDVDGWICDTVDVYVREAISLDLNVNPDMMCQDSTPLITPTIYPAGTYSLDWYSGPNATGTYLGTGSSFTPLSTGTYSVVVTDLVYNFGCNTDTINFPMSYDYTGPTIKNTPPTLYLECNDPNYDDIIYNWLESPSAEYVNQFGDTVEAQVNYDYYSSSGPVTMICGDSVRVQFSAFDQCSNDTIEYAYIVVIDTTKPVLTPAIDSTIQCSTTDPDEDPGFLAWIANHGGATATDLCDPVLTWSVDTAYTDWTWDPADNERTVTFYVTDACGNVDSTTATFSVIDTVAPQLYCPGDFSDTIPPDSCSISRLTMDTIWAIDDCSVPELYYIVTPPNGSSFGGYGQVNNITFDVGISRVQYWATDDAGLQDSCSFIVEVKQIDIADTLYQCPQDYWEANADATCEAYMDLDSLYVISDPCNVFDSIWHDSPYSSDPQDADGYYPIGTTNFNWYIRNISGVIESCPVTVVVNDDYAPELICPDDVVDSLYNGGCDIIPDNIGNPILSADCSPLELYYELTLPDGFTDGDSGLVNNYRFPIGRTDVMYIVQDTFGNADSCTFYVLIKDTISEGYDYECPNPNLIEAWADASCEAPIDLDVLNVIDTCDAIDTFWHNSPIYDPADPINPDGNYPIGHTQFYWYILNYAGDLDSCEVNIVVYDTLTPYFEFCPPNAIDSLINDDCDLISDQVQSPRISGDCSPLELLYELYLPNGDTVYGIDSAATYYPYPPGRTDVHYILRDTAGNETYCDFYVIIKVDLEEGQDIDYPDDFVEEWADRDSCGAWVTLLPVTVLDTCDAIDSIWHDSDIYIDSMNPSGFYPIDTTVFNWYVRERDGTVHTYPVTVLVHDYMPELTCPPDTTVYAIYNETYAILELPPPTFHDNCPDSTLIWDAWWQGNPVLTYGDTASSGINILTGPDTFNIGVTYIEYTFTDQHGHDTTCTFTVTVEAAPIIECPPSDTFYADDQCEYWFDPGVARLISGAQPIWWTWTITDEYGNVLDTGLDTTTATDTVLSPIVSTAPNEYPFQLGVTTITWTAENLAGADTCWHEILVIDTTPPTIYELDSLEDCMEVIQFAIYSSDEQDLYYPDRPDYIVFEQGDTTLDLTVIDEYNDNCELSCPDSITWVIDFSSYTDQHGNNVPAQDSVYWGSGQISDYPTDMQFPGDGTYMGDVEHWVSYFATDCAGNTSLVGRRRIIVTPRPKIVKETLY